MVKMHAETKVSLHVKCLLLLSTFNQNFLNAPYYLISKKSKQQFSSCTYEQMD
jgi:hypothetical protein